jgi:hypothetical protein
MHPGILGRERADRLGESFAADVHRDVAYTATVPQRLEQPAYLAAGSGPQLHDVTRGQAAHQVTGDVAQDPVLGPRQVVLGQLRDPLEEDGAGLVVEVLGRQLSRACREPAPDVLRHSSDEPRFVGVNLEKAAHASPQTATVRKPATMLRRCRM